MNEMTIREYQDKDAKSVKELITSILSKEFSFAKGVYPEADLDAIPRIYGGKREIFYVMEDEEKIVGTVGIKEDSKEAALLRRIFVDPSYRGKGCGARLLDKAIGFCKEAGYHRITFRSTGAMKAANELCLKRGFKEKDRLLLEGIEIVMFDYPIAMGSRHE